MSTLTSSNEKQSFSWAQIPFRYRFWPFSAFLTDAKKDAPFAFIFTRFFLLQLPLALVVFSLSDLQGLPLFLLGILYISLTVFLLGPHLLMLHNICHRNPWQKKYRNTMKWIIEFMGLFYGLPPRLYYYHHIKMHHREGNGPHDLSSTEKYQRDSFLHWLHYFLTFVFLGPILLPSYFYRRNKKDFALKVLIGYLFFYTFLITVSLLNAKGALIVFVLPTLLCWFGLMSGNWTQHAFLDQENPDDSYLNSITVIDALYNQRCFNDGYHIGHHLYPGMHWSEMPSEFQNNLNEYHQKRTVIFKTLDYQTIWVFLMFKNYKKIAQYIVQDPNNKRDLEETITFLKSKLAPIKR